MTKDSLVKSVVDNIIYLYEENYYAFYFGSSVFFHS